MEPNNKLEEKRQAELKKITLKIIERYEVYDYPLAYKIAEAAYNDGIHLDKFKKEYYKDPFNLDEIIYYLIKKETTNQKIVPFQPKEEGISTIKEQPAEIIPITLKISSRIKR